eukprot:12594035-Prorocentrum_lima.AAC.1
MEGCRVAQHSTEPWLPRPLPHTHPALDVSSSAAGATASNMADAIGWGTQHEPARPKACSRGGGEASQSGYLES